MRAALIARHPFFPLARQAAISACLREREASLSLLRAAMDSQDLTFLHTAISPALDWLSGDAELLALQARSGIWRAWRQEHQAQMHKAKS